MTQISQKSITNNGLEIYYDIAGHGATTLSIICLHGLASNASRWHEFMQNTTLTEFARVAAPDLRGHGRSMTRRAYQRKHWCDDVAAMVRQFDTPCILIGHSLGAQVALEYAVSKPESLAGMVLIDPIFPQALTGTLKKVSRFRLLLWLAILLLRMLQPLGIFRRKFPGRSLFELDVQTREFLAQNPHKGIADLYMNPLADLKYLPLVNYLQDLYEVTRPLSELDGIRTPMLVLLSEGASTSHVETNKKLLSKLQDCQIHPIPADHWLLTEKPLEARKAIENWITQHIIKVS
jgi:pimeloyl-ACP methyl ester carboxylesterase